MAKNANLTRARKEKNDEFYTQLSDIEKELCHYTNHFEGKTVFCNCDDPRWSNFVKYFILHFNELKLKKLVTCHYAPTGKEERSFSLEVTEVGENAQEEYDELIKELKALVIE